jgi:hypothetical protein
MSTETPEIHQKKGSQDRSCKVARSLALRPFAEKL